VTQLWRSGTVSAALIAVAMNAVATSVGATVETGAGAQALLYQPGAREHGLGGAGVADTEGRAIGYFNPAVIASRSGMPVEGMMPSASPPRAGMTYYRPNQQSGFSAPQHYAHFTVVVDSTTIFDMFRQGTGAASITYLESALTAWSGHTLIIGGSYATPVREDLSVGLTAKYIQESGSEQASIAVALDVGVIWRAATTFVLGAALRNLGPNMLYADDLSAPLPLAFSVGAQWTALALSEHTVNVVGDMYKPLLRRDTSRWYLSPLLGWGDDSFGEEMREVVLRTGVEYAFAKRVMLRCGLERHRGLDRTRITVGAGVLLPIAKDRRQELGIDIGSSYNVGSSESDYSNGRIITSVSFAF
jgi:hypothetical protein